MLDREESENHSHYFPTYLSSSAVCALYKVSTLGGDGAVYSMNEWMAWIIHGQRRDWMRKLWSANPSSSSETDLCRNYQIMSTLMIVIITCVAGYPSIRRTFIEFCVRCQEEYVAWSSSATDGAKQPKNDFKTTNYQHHFQNRLNGDDLFQFMPHSSTTTHVVGI